MRKLMFCLTIACIAFLSHAEFSAGFARLDVTPPLGIPIPGYFSKRISDGVLDPLCVECVAVSDGTNAALIYTVDDVHLSNKFFEKAFPAITAATGIPRDRIYVHSTHTHTGATDWPRDGFEIVIADAGSTDRTLEIARAGGADVILIPEIPYDYQKDVIDRLQKIGYEVIVAKGADEAIQAIETYLGDERKE